MFIVTSPTTASALINRKYLGLDLCSMADGVILSCAEFKKCKRNRDTRTINNIKVTRISNSLFR
jgi:hypothetical protein